jgi:hypothetical protein
MRNQGKYADYGPLTLIGKCIQLGNYKRFPSQERYDTFIEKITAEVKSLGMLTESMRTYASIIAPEKGINKCTEKTEALVMLNSVLSFEYLFLYYKKAINVKGLEEALFLYPDLCLLHSKWTTKKRFIEAEIHILKNPGVRETYLALIKTFKNDI